MTIVVGVSPTHRTQDGIQLATMLARSRGTDLLIVAVVPAPWEGRGALLDAEYREYLRSRARDTLRETAESIDTDIVSATRVRESASISEGLVAAAREVEAPMLVLGSSTTSLLGRVGLGSVTERLLHSSPVPVAVAPRGFSSSTGVRVARVSIAYAVGPDESGLIEIAADVGRQIGAAVRLVSFAVRPGAPVTSGVGRDAERQIVDEWANELRSTTDALDRRIETVAGPGVREAPVMGRGETWGRALETIDWMPGEVLVVGSSRTERSRRVFLGGTASKIARHSPVPVIVVPRQR